MIRAFTDKKEEINIDSLQKVLGNCASNYNDLMVLIKRFETKWTFYKGWSQKVFDKKKALLYITPYYDGYIVSAAIRENERNNLLDNKNMSFIHQVLAATKKVSEGYPLRMEVTDNQLATMCNKVICAIIRFR